MTNFTSSSLHVLAADVSFCCRKLVSFEPLLPSSAASWRLHATQCYNDTCQLFVILCRSCVKQHDKHVSRDTLPCDVSQQLHSLQHNTTQ